MPCEKCDFFHFSDFCSDFFSNFLSDFFSDFFSDFLVTFLATFSAGSSWTLWVTVKLKFVNVVEAGKSKSWSWWFCWYSASVLFKVFLMHWFITNDPATSSEFFFDSPYNETKSVDCSRLVQPRFLRILLSCLRLSRNPWTLRGINFTLLYLGQV